MQCRAGLGSRARWRDARRRGRSAPGHRCAGRGHRGPPTSTRGRPRPARGHWHEAFALRPQRGELVRLEIAVQLLKLGAIGVAVHLFHGFVVSCCGAPLDAQYPNYMHECEKSVSGFWSVTRAPHPTWAGEGARLQRMTRGAEPAVAGPCEWPGRGQVVADSLRSQLQRGQQILVNGLHRVAGRGG